MTDKPSTRVSLRKKGVAEDPPAAPPDATERPRFAKYAVGALLLAGVASVITALDLLGLHDWLYRSAVRANAKLKPGDQKTTTELHHSVTSTVHTQLVASVVVLVALAVVASAVWRGRYWARWAVVGLWLLASLTSTFAGFTWLFTIGQSQPAGFKIPLLVASVSFAVAVVLVNLRPTVAYFNLTRPARPDRARGPRSVGDLVRESESLPGSSPIRGRVSRTEKLAAIRQASAERRAQKLGTEPAAPSAARGSTVETAPAASAGAPPRNRARTSKSRRTEV